MSTRCSSSAGEIVIVQLDGRQGFTTSQTFGMGQGNFAMGVSPLVTSTNPTVLGSWTGTANGQVRLEITGSHVQDPDDSGMADITIAGGALSGTFTFDFTPAAVPDRFEIDPVINGKLILSSSPGGYVRCRRS